MHVAGPWRKSLSVALLLLVGVAVGVSIVQVAGRNVYPPTSASSGGQEGVGEKPRPLAQDPQFQHEGAEVGAPNDPLVLVYLFHGSMRCPTCLAIETTTKEVVTTQFPAEIQSGKVVIKEINVEEPPHRHFIQKYQLVAPTVVMVRVQNGQEVRSANLMEVWQLIRNRAAFQEFIVRNLQMMLEGNS